jgi:pyruvate dehydrogenase E1 component alpha subunit
VGEPLNPEAVVWSEKVFGQPFHDNWWQTETGGIMIANRPGMEVRPGSMGKPLPGIEAGIVEKTEDGLTELGDGEIGELALRPGWPSMMRPTSMNRRATTSALSTAGTCRAISRCGTDGYFWFVGRADDLIKTSGHLIGPFEVESALIEHEAVAEAGVIGVPDETAGEVVKAYVTLNPGFEARGPRTRHSGARAQDARPRRRPARDRVPHDPAQDPLRQDHAPPSEGARAWPAGRGHFHIGDRRDMTVIDKPHLDRAHVLDLLAHMIRIRRFEDKCAELYTQQKIRGFLHLYDGEEAIAAGVIPVLSDRDRIVATYREHGQALVRGVPMNTVMAEMYGKAEGCSGGRGGSMHLFDAATEFYGGNAIVGGGLPLAGGLALADKMTGEDRVTACFFGDGAVAEGEFHETLNLAELWDLPVLFVCENNGYAMGTAIGRYESQTDIRAKAAAYNIAAEAVDGMDVVAVEAATRRALAAIRETGRPFFLECNTYRFRAHSMFDAQLYREKTEIETWRAQGPIVRFQGWLLENGLIHEADVTEIERASMPRSRRPWPSPKTARGSRWKPDEPRPRTPARAGRACRAIGRDGRDDLSRGGQAGDPRRDDPRRARVPDGRGCGRLWRLLRRDQGADGRVRRGPHPRHAPVGVGFTGAGIGAARRGCGPSWS